MGIHGLSRDLIQTLAEPRDQKMKIIKLIFVFLLFVSFVSCAPIEEENEGETIITSTEISSDEFQSFDYNSDDLLDLEDTTTDEEEEESSTEILTTIVSTTKSPTHRGGPTKATTTTTTTTAVNRSPKIKNGPSRKEVFTLGEPFVLGCKAESLFDSEIRYTWTKHGRPFIINGVDVFNESSLNGNILFISPKSSDEGTYQCEAINDFGKAFSQASLL